MTTLPEKYEWISGICWNHEFKDVISVLRDEKIQMYFSISKILQTSYFENYWVFNLHTVAFLYRNFRNLTFDHFFMISYSLFKCHYKVANLLTSSKPVLLLPNIRSASSKMGYFSQVCRYLYDVTIKWQIYILPLYYNSHN